MGNQTFRVTRPPFVVDQKSINRNSGRQVDWSAVPDSYRQGAVAVTASATAATGATTMAVSALGGAIPANTTLYFGATGRFALVTAAAAAGATQLSVQALPVQIPNAGTAVYGGSGAKTLPAGKAVVELTGGKIAPRSDRPGSETCVGFLETNAIENDVTASKSGYGVIIGGVLYENLLPDATGGTTGTLTAAYKTELSNATNPPSTGFAFEQYADNRT